MPRFLVGFTALTVIAGLGLVFTGANALANTSTSEQVRHRLPVAAFRVVERESGPTNYYRLFKDAEPPFIRAEYHPPYETTVLAVQVADADRASARALSWKWRALALPKG